MALGTCSTSMPSDMPRPAMIFVGATMQALMPCFDSKSSTLSLQPASQAFQDDIAYRPQEG